MDDIKTKEITLYTVEFSDGSNEYVAEDELYSGVMGVGDTLELALGSCLSARKAYEDYLQEKADADPFEREEIYNENVYDDDEMDKDPNLERGWKNRE